MNIWIYSDEKHRILGANPNDMTGNTGWEQAEAQDGFDLNNIWDEYRVPLYKFVDGEIAERSEEERAADRPKPQPPQPTDRERIETLEQSLNLILSGEVE